ncbi:uncharacterized protein DUF1631 [Tamilnaduibacter salinus]|uniref:Uncharacterized protein DUF1631 n=1 Tax=Tamilnaduibacter salinus TaxID=1484056 RepID=A0A2A2I7W3_9GAMM|nr:DUF1631 domain-containing protein [Tamilnaduibacter salinus]PAV27210.1 hypothetical protein CF392_01795 [Tamilnaduibacter salinus]PVY78954.1 uncharacterized protein DUF1631 [Tamilnaduibacter salinus]
MTRQSGIHYIHEHRQGGGPANLPGEISRIRETVVAGLGDLLQGAFDAVDDSLFELANNARSNNEQNRYFEAMREIRIKRRGVEKAFKESVSRLFSDPPGSRTPETPVSSNPSSDTLSLVENDELEEQVALNAMISKSRAYFQGPLLQLQTRFTAIYPQASEEAPVNPMAPEHLCGAFVETAQALEIQIRERLIVLKQFDRYVVSNLGMLLDEANRILIQAGIIPNFRYHARQAEQSEEAPKSPADATTQTESDSHTRTAAEGAADEAFFDQIRSLLAGQRQHWGSAHQSDDSFHVIGSQELNQLINALPQPQTPPPSGNLSQGEPVVVDLRRAVESLLEQQQTSDGKPAALEETDEDLINLVSMLFEFILDDYNLSPPIQVLISRLQIPILKVVIKDRTFFSRATHPARKLLNALARAGIGWSDSDEKTRDKLYEQIHAIVARILEEFDGDIGLFEQLGEEFEQFLARENRKAALVEQRTRESERGRIKSQKAQETVDDLLQRKLSDQTIPDTVHSILMNGWSRVMFLAYLRDDVEHRWNQSVRVVDDLIWCLHPHLDDEERDQWVRVVPGLLKTLRAGLEEVSYNATRLDDMMASLKHELTEAFRNHAQAEAREPAADTPTEASGEDTDDTAEPTAIERQQELEEAAVAEYLGQIDEIAVGNWVEFSLVNGTRFRCKLSAIIDEAECLVFVNRMGLKVIEKTRTDLAHELRQGRLTILEQGALIDRAMDAVMGSLRRSAG